MKQAKILVFSLVIVLAAFTAVTYSSCKKASCNGVVCENGGSCSKGSCSCPAGYSGSSCQLSSILFQNNTFSTINISVNGAPNTIPVAGSIIFSAPCASVVTVNATTSAVSASGILAGSVISWSLFDTLPSGGAGFTQPFNVSSNYFYLQIVNDNPADYIDSIYVNYGTPLQTLSAVSIPNDRTPYGIGYFRDSTNTAIYALGTPAGSWSWTTGIPDTANYTVVLRAN